jgi:hypothetical protein
MARIPTRNGRPAVPSRKRVRERREEAAGGAITATTLVLNAEPLQLNGENLSLGS